MQNHSVQEPATFKESCFWDIYAVQLTFILLFLRRFSSKLLLPCFLCQADLFVVNYTIALKPVFPAVNNQFYVMGCLL